MMNFTGLLNVTGWPVGPVRFDLESLFEGPVEVLSGLEVSKFAI